MTYSACGDYITWPNCRAFRNGLDQGRYREDKVVACGILSKFAVDVRLQAKSSWEILLGNCDWSLQGKSTSKIGRPIKFFRSRTQYGERTIGQKVSGDLPM